MDKLEFRYLDKYRRQRVENNWSTWYCKILYYFIPQMRTIFVRVTIPAGTTKMIRKYKLILMAACCVKYVLIIHSAREQFNFPQQKKQESPWEFDARVFAFIDIECKISENIECFINNLSWRVYHGRKKEKNQLYLSLPTGLASTPKNFCNVNCLRVSALLLDKVSRGQKSVVLRGNNPFPYLVASSDGHSMLFPRNFQSNLSTLQPYVRGIIKYR